MSNSTMKPTKTLESTHYSSAYEKYKSYGKYFSQKHSNRYGNSSFWMDDLVDSRTDNEEKFDILKMAQYQRAIANFVKIVARKDIPVKFSSKDRSYTDSQTVVLSANITDKSFDVTAGLALHEASHIIFTDFEVSKEFFPRGTNSYDSQLDTWFGILDASSSYFVQDHMPFAYSKSFHNMAITSMKLFGLVNWIEDRRIDSEIFRMAPGYKTYYHTLYEKYYLSRDITKALKSKEFRNSDADSYTFRVEALLNPASDPKALPGLQHIINVLDLHNISRLKSTKDSIQLALEIADLICKYVDMGAMKPQQNKQNPKPQQNDEGNGGEGQDDMQMNNGPGNEYGDQGQDGNDDAESGNGMPTMGEGESDEEQSGMNAPEIESLPGLTLQELSKAKKAIDDMQKLIQGNVKKAKATKEVSGIVDAIAGSNEFNVDTVNFNGANVPVVKIYLSDRILRSAGHSDMLYDVIYAEAVSSYFIPGKHFSMPPKSTWSSLNPGRKAALDGLNLGTQLGRKLQVRDQVRDTKYTRLKSGKIDSRILYQAGYDATNIFHTVSSDKYTPSVIDISIDASSSMSGNKWWNTQTAVLAIAKACSMIQNVRVKVSYRYEANLGSGKDKLLLVDAYDSKRDKITHLANLVFAMKPINCTPDSLITKYQLNKKMITPGGPELNSYFINFSDGGPGSSVGNLTYGGRPAHDHIKKCRKEIESMNVKVMSYYISEGTHSSESNVIRQFKDDWGIQNAKQINVTDVLALAKTMNEMFLSK